jgi:hypothetical protein
MINIERMIAEKIDTVCDADSSGNYGVSLYRECVRSWRLLPTEIISFEHGLV